MVQGEGDSVDGGGYRSTGREGLVVTRSDRLGTRTHDERAWRLRLDKNWGKTARF